ncbi:HEAT repeat domain-containing protein [Acidobacteriota bacterium]
MTRSKNILKKLLPGVLLAAGGLAVLYLVACLSIYTGIREITLEAMDVHSGDRIEALMSHVDSEEVNLRKRNRAVWALGQLGDPRALPLLERLITGESDDYGKNLSQYELKKAIKKCNGSLNITAWIKRFLPTSRNVMLNL